jgi:hypothetical protein
METMEMNRNEIIEQAADIKLDYSDVMSTSYLVYEDRLENGNIPAKSGKVYQRKMGLKNATEVAKEISYLEDSFTYVKSAKTGKIVAIYLEGDEVE